ncbi:MAG TPA: NAD(P)/FAD-dependent oxidoreductase [Mycobacteriales bacterium]|nr:NAD(P)/FAD-dependent oxidoreductase [Mycobacteriales bacterium]
MDSSASDDLPAHVDVLVVGAGIAGIGAAYRLQTRCPDRTYLVLEARSDMGGTWDAFRYPGVRSDSDIFTLSFPFHPWTGAHSMADGPDILAYLRDTASRFGIDRHIRCGTRVLSADWSSADALWTVTVQQADMCTTLTCRFLYACTGYYDHDAAHVPQLPGLADFAGRVVVPQFWPADLDVAGQRVVVVGSGATAITLVPALAREGATVTMLQRTPTYIGSGPRQDPWADTVRRRLPARAAHWVIRTRNAAKANHFYWWCRRYPERARALFLGGAARALGADVARDHFTPPYAPWDQRVCLAADGDFFLAVRKKKADVVTDQVERFVPDGIRLQGSGEVLPADVVVLATGLQMQVLGRLALSLDGTPVRPEEHVLWRGALLSGVPNFAMCIGYVSLSWTMRADLTSRLVCRVLDHMRRRDLAAVTVDPPAPDVARLPLMDLRSGYVRRSIDAFPRLGDRGPWRMRQIYALDSAGIATTRLARHLRGVRRRDLPAPSPAALQATR